MNLRFLVLPFAACALLLSACSGMPSGKDDSSVNPASASTGLSDSGATPAEGQAAPLQAVATMSADPAERAFADSEGGRLVIRPYGQVTEEKLGAPSCLGKESDIQWQGSFEAVWLPADGPEQRVARYEDGFDGDGIIQPDAKSVKMEALSVGSAQIYALSPRYTDCHALPTYFYAVEDGKAFAVPLVFGPNETKQLMARLPIGGMESKDGELLLAEGYGAGQDTINVYHFRYNSAARQLERTATDRHDAASFVEQTLANEN